MINFNKVGVSSLHCFLSKSMQKPVYFRKAKNITDVCLETFTGEMHAIKLKSLDALHVYLT